MIKYEVINDIVEAEKLWNLFSDNAGLYDLWEFRYCFYKYYNYPLNFIVGYDQGQPIGLLPLQYNNDKNYLEFFGGSYMDSNRLFIQQRYKKYIPGFYNQIKQKAKLLDIIGDDSFTRSLPLEDHNYSLNISEFNNIQECLNKLLPSKKRKVKIIEKNKINILNNNPYDLNLMIELNIKRFGKDSIFNLPHYKKIFHDLLELEIQCNIITIEINNIKEAVAISVFYNNVYYYLCAGSNIVNIPNLGSYVTIKTIEKAIALKSKIYDAGIGDCGWKELWHFNKHSQYKFIK